MFIARIARRVHHLTALAVAIAALGTPASLLGQPAGTPTGQAPEVISLERAIEIALARNASVQQAENAARLSSLTVEQQERQFLPELNMNAGTGFPYDTPNGPQDPTVTAGISASVQIGNVYSTFANLRQARINESASVENLTRSRQTVVFTVMSNYLSLIEAQEQLGVQEQNLRSVEAQEAQIRAYVEAGRRPISDLYQQQASTASARLSVVQAERGLNVARMNLLRTLHLDPFGEYEFVVPELESMSVSFTSQEPDALARQALEQRPDLRASEMSLASAEQGLRIARASRWPNLSLQLGYNSGNFNSAQGGGLFDQFDQGRRGTLSLNVSVPIVDFTHGISRERAQIQLENARIGLESARLAVTNEVRTAYLDLQLSEEQLEVAELQMQAADLALQISQQRYDVGAGTLVELTQAQTSQVRAASALVNARYELIFRSRLMDYYLGNLDADVTG